MTLRCIYCGRALKAAGAWTLGKPIGPTCAKRNGQQVRKAKAAPRAAAVEVAAGQLPLDLAA